MVSTIQTNTLRLHGFKTKLHGRTMTYGNMWGVSINAGRLWTAFPSSHSHPSTTSSFALKRSWWPLLNWWKMEQKNSQYNHSHDPNNRPLPTSTSPAIAPVECGSGSTAAYQINFQWQPWFADAKRVSNYCPVYTFNHSNNKTPISGALKWCQ
jgi:hypothetical protein